MPLKANSLSQNMSHCAPTLISWSINNIRFRIIAAVQCLFGNICQPEYPSNTSPCDELNQSTINRLPLIKCMMKYLLTDFGGKALPFSKRQMVQQAVSHTRLQYKIKLSNHQMKGRPRPNNICVLTEKKN